MRTPSRTPSAEPASAAAATAARRGSPGPAAGRIVVAALVTGLAATAVVAESGRGHSPVARLSAASAALRPGRSGPQTRQAPAAAYSPPAVLAAVLSTRTALPKPTTITARGSVTCLSGRAVEGVWLVGLHGGSGWATWRASAAAPQFATFSRPIPAGRWSVHVGCGGSPLSWKAAIYSGWVSGTPRSFGCDDVPGLGQFGECSA
jgi:hypothetical protein